MQEFVLFQANDSKFKYDFKADEKTALSVLVTSRNYLLSNLKNYLPVTHQIYSMLPKVKTVKELVVELKNVKPSAMEEKFSSFITLKWPSLEQTPKNASPMDFGWIALLNQAWTSINSFDYASKGNYSKKEIRFAANYDGWVLVKKVNFDIATPQEVLAFMSTTFSSIDRKIGDLAALDYEQFDSFWNDFSSKFSPRKSYAKLTDMLLKATDLEAEIKKLAKPGMESYLIQHFYHKLFVYAGYAPFATIETINGNYPELKIPKPKGNFGGKKKKKTT
ncbi:hypothetical protein HUU53_03125 [Candidatus Micrarchaeota archaeon]|nr:hypothetical protein [Candidatus Micrarchaeota archaeon]